MAGPEFEESAEELLENAPCGYLSAAPDGMLTRVNGTFLRWTGYRREELVGVKRFQDLLSVGGRIYHETHYAPMLRMQGVVREIAVDVVSANGRRLPVLVNSVLLRDADGEPRVVRTRASRHGPSDTPQPHKIACGRDNPGAGRSPVGQVRARRGPADRRRAIYVATARVDPADREWTARIAAHVARRPAGWRTVEPPDLPDRGCCAADRPGPGRRRGDLADRRPGRPRRVGRRARPGCGPSATGSAAAGAAPGRAGAGVRRGRPRRRARDPLWQALPGRARRAQRCRRAGCDAGAAAGGRDPVRLR